MLPRTVSLHNDIVLHFVKLVFFFSQFQTTVDLKDKCGLHFYEAGELKKKRIK